MSVLGPYFNCAFYGVNRSNILLSVIVSWVSLSDFLIAFFIVPVRAAVNFDGISSAQQTRSAAIVANKLAKAAYAYVSLGLVRHFEATLETVATHTSRQLEEP